MTEPNARDFTFEQLQQFKTQSFEIPGTRREGSGETGKFIINSS